MLIRLGLPDVRGHRRFVTAIAIDAVGSGVFMPLAVLYFVRTTSVGFEQVGVALSVAAAIAIPATLLVGPLVDRWGAKVVLLASNALGAVGYSLYGQAHSLVGIALVATLTSTGSSIFWASYSPMVAAISRAGEREKWFGFMGALRNVGFAVGGLLAGVLISINTTDAFHFAVWCNAGTLLLSFLLLLQLAESGRAAPHPSATPRTTWRTVLADRSYGLVVATNAVYALACLTLNYAIPLYTVELLHLPGWLVGVIYTVNTVLAGFGQSWAVARMTGYLRWRIVLVAYLLFGFSFGLFVLVGFVPVWLAVVLSLIACVIYTGGEILAGPILTTIAADARPAHQRGRYMAYYQLSWQLASVTAPALFGWLIAHGRVSLWVVLIALLGLGTVTLRRSAARLPIARQPVTNSAHASAS